MHSVLAILFNIILLIVPPYFTQAVDGSAVATLRVTVDDDPLVTPVVRLGGESRVNVSFDDITYDPRNYYYKIVHCNALWQPSDLMPMEYLDGMDDIMLSDYSFSENTTANYIHYSFSLPNDDVRFTKSGNYAVLIARDNDFEAGVVAVACFSVVEPLASLVLECSPNTLLGINGQYQQVTVNADIEQVRAVNPLTDFVLTVRQNDRRDNEAVLDRPTFTAGRSVQYTNSPKLTFEAGNLYRTVDFSSRYTYGSGIDRFIYQDDAYHVLLDPVSMGEGRRTDGSDAHGRFVVHLQGAGEYADTDADYGWVHFTLRAPEPFVEGRVALLGGLNYNALDERALMQYDFDNHLYYLAVYLKQGGYNFQYIYLPREGRPTLLPTEGSYWQTPNAYRAFLYYRPQGARYDRLVGFGELQ